MKKTQEILKQYWGYDHFRPLQEEIVDSVIYGHDTLAILPTGGGKSICFQIPGMGLDGLTLVISPLIALMQDQVESLLKKGINAACITGAMSYREIDITLDNARFGNMKFLYTSPERLKSTLFIERFKEMPISLIVVDEAHCISEWGHEFRPAYREIKDIKLYHPNAPIIALTASATDHVKQDIIEQLDLRSPKLFYGSLERPNIHYRVQATENKLGEILSFCKSHSNVSGIVYCQTRRSVKELVKQLRSQKVPAGFYTVVCPVKIVLICFLNGKMIAYRFMIATNAFGMGIDKPNVRYVLHYEMPNNLEAYYQEAGRAGRDEKSALALAFWEQEDLRLMQERLNAKFPPIDQIRNIYNALFNFLTIAYSSGSGESYEFDMASFTKVFKFSVAEVYYTLQLLQLDQRLIFSENSFHPTRVKFAIGNAALYKFQVTHDTASDFNHLVNAKLPRNF